MSELRKQFEALAYNNKWNICRYPQSDYHNKEGQYCDEFVDGAWYAFQEQQKAIENLKVGLTDIWTNLDDRQSKEWIIEHCENIIKELLK